MTAIRLARAFTGRAEDRQVRRLLPRPRRRAARARRLGRDDASACPTAPACRRRWRARRWWRAFNDRRRGRGAASRAEGEAIAAVIVEPVVGNMGVVPPADGFLDGLRELTAAHGALLIFDEVITGFRLAYGGVQTLFGIRPGSHLPRQDHRRRPAARRLRRARATSWSNSRRSAPSTRPARSRGIRSRSRPGLATLELLDEPGTYEQLEALGARLEAGSAGGAASATAHAAASTASARCGRCSSASTRCATPTSARACDTARLRPLLPGHARARHLPAAVAVRGGVRLARPQRGRHRRRRVRGGRSSDRRALRGRLTAAGTIPWRNRSPIAPTAMQLPGARLRVRRDRRPVGGARRLLPRPLSRHRAAVHAAADLRGHGRRAASLALVAETV